MGSCWGIGHGRRGIVLGIASTLGNLSLCTSLSDEKIDYRDGGTQQRGKYGKNGHHVYENRRIQYAVVLVTSFAIKRDVNKRANDSPIIRPSRWRGLGSGSAKCCYSKRKSLKLPAWAREGSTNLNFRWRACAQDRKQETWYEIVGKELKWKRWQVSNHRKCMGDRSGNRETFVNGNKWRPLYFPWFRRLRIMNGSRTSYRKLLCLST